MIGANVGCFVARGRLCVIRHIYSSSIEVEVTVAVVVESLSLFSSVYWLYDSVPVVIVFDDSPLAL